MRFTWLIILFLIIHSTGVYGQFSGRKEISRSVRSPYSGKLYDLDNDGDLDILSCSIYDSKVVWYENDGNGGFDKLKIISNHYYSYTFNTAEDLDGDGDLDVIATASFANVIVWFENFGSGEFSSDILLDDNVIGINDVVTGDVDNDGDVDIFCASGDDYLVTWFENHGNGNFSSKKTVTTGLYKVNSVDLADFDGDGLMDVLSNESYVSDKICWMKNMGNGFFGPQQTVTTGVNVPLYTYAKDVDNDGDMDVISCSASDDDFYWWSNDGFGSFSYEATISSANWARRISSADLNHDGHLDMVCSSGTWPNYYVWIKLNDGNAQFTSTYWLTDSLVNPAEFDFGDINNDGLTDILIMGRDANEIHWFENDGSGINYIDHYFDYTLDDISSMDIADFDNDDKIDIVLASRNNNSILWYKNLGSNLYSQGVVVSNSVQKAEFVKVNDLNNDGNQDILSVSDMTNEIFYHQNDGNGNFNTSTIYSGMNIEGSTVYCVDIDSDNDLDIFTRNSNNEILFIENTGGTTFAPEQIIPTPSGTFYYKITSKDLDADSDEDLILSAWSLDQIIWIENQGNGSFGSAQVLVDSIDAVYNVIAEDVDEDGDFDLIATAHDGESLSWYENLGGGNYGVQNIIDTNLSQPRSIAVDDVDSDGDLDIIYAGDTTKVIWYESTSNGYFYTKHLVSDASYRVLNVLLSDLDNDGDVEIISGGENNVLAFHENMSNSDYKLSGTTFYDHNEDGLFNGNDFGMSDFSVSITPYTNSSFTNNSGDYFFSVAPGNHTIECNINGLWHLTGDSLTYNKLVSSSNPIFDSLDFGVFPDTILSKVEIDLEGGFPRCNAVVKYWVTVSNAGTTWPSGYLHLSLDDSVDFISSSFIPDSISGQNIFWSYDSLQLGATMNYSIEVQMPSFMSMGDTLNSNLNIFEVDTNNSTSIIGTDEISQILVCAYDPNDKTVTPLGLGSPRYILAGDELEYRVRFQNTGNDTAINVMIRDQLDAELDWSTLDVISSSHNMSYWVEQDGELIFDFQNIMLPDSIIDEPGSHGFVKYKIQSKVDAPANAVISNRADIYFDQNPAILTNTVYNSIYDCHNLDFTINSSLLCFGDTLVGETILEPFNTYTWAIDSINYGAAHSFNWPSDSSNLFDLTLNVDNPLCFKDTTTQIEVLPLIPLSVLNDSICLMDSTFFGGEYVFGAGNYFDTLQTVNGCDSIIELQLMTYDLPAVVLNEFAQDTICSYMTIDLPYGIPLGGAYSGTGISGNIFDGSLVSNGLQFIIYEFIDSNNCINSDTSWISVDECLSLNDYSSGDLITYPNPASDIIFIEGNHISEGVITLFNLEGKPVRVSVDCSNDQCKMNVSNLTRGVYVLEYNSHDRIIQKLVIVD